MKALLCKEFGPPEKLVLEEVGSPSPRNEQVVVQVKACSVTFPDLLIVQGKYQFKPKLPFSPGVQVAGIVKAVGQEVTGLRPGDRVIAACRWGGMAEEVLTMPANCIPLPPEAGYASGAAMVLTYGTSHYALKDRARLAPGETLVVLGAAGGVGLAAVELGKVMGARVIAAASTQEKIDLAKRQGADEGFVYPSGKLSKDDAKALTETIKQRTGGKGTDVLYDPVGGDYTEPCLRAMAWQGRYLVVGFAAGEIGHVPLNLALLKGCTIQGVYWGAFTAQESERNAENLAEIARWIAQGKLKPQVCASFPLTRGAEAIRMLADRKALGKVMVTVP